MYPNGAAIPPILPKPPSRPTIPPSPTRTHRGDSFPVPGPLLAPAPRPPDRGPLAGPVARPSSDQTAARGSTRPRWPAQPPAPPALAAYGAATVGPTSAATPQQQQPPHHPIPRPSPADNVGPSLPGPPPLLAPPPDPLDDALLPAASAYNYGTWTAADDRTLLAARARGQHWGELQASHFPTKTANACRKRHERLMERRGAGAAGYDGGVGTAGDARRFEKIASEYMAMRREIWGGLAGRVQERWEFVEREVSFFLRLLLLLGRKGVGLGLKGGSVGDERGVMGGEGP